MVHTLYKTLRRALSAAVVKFHEIEKIQIQRAPHIRFRRMDGEFHKEVPQDF